MSLLRTPLQASLAAASLFCELRTARGFKGRYEGEPEMKVTPLPHRAAPSKGLLACSAISTIIVRVNQLTAWLRRGSGGTQMPLSRSIRSRTHTYGAPRHYPTVRVSRAALALLYYPWYSLSLRGLVEDAMTLVMFRWQHERRGGARYGVDMQRAVLPVARSCQRMMCPSAGPGGTLDGIKEANNARKVRSVFLVFFIDW